MYVAGLWRYPVKSLAGESLSSASVGDDGVAGDRIVHVRGPHGVLTGRTRHQLLRIPASTGPGGVPLVAGHRWDSPAALEVVRAAAGPSRLVAYHGPERFDVLNLLVATSGAVDAFGADIRRLRPNVLIGGVPLGAEQAWPGQALIVGDVVIGIHSHRGRCIVTSIDPSTGTQDLEIFRRIRTEFGNELCMNSWVIQPGVIHLGAPVKLVPVDAHPARIGGWITGAPYTLTSRRSL